MIKSCGTLVAKTTNDQILRGTCGSTKELEDAKTVSRVKNEDPKPLFGRNLLIRF